MKKKASRNANDSKDSRNKHQEAQIVSAVTDDCFHRFTEEELLSVAQHLLEWYYANKRDLPWRQQSMVSDLNQRAYGVWVSEIMLQQTQVATVVDYYRRWMERWPTLQDLAQAKLEEVNEMWSGLGYYSRGRRLHEGAQKVVQQLGGEMPRKCGDLQKELPGVGRYTAGAIASIAFQQKTGVVDGNVIRVLSRLRMIGADSAAQSTMDLFWELSNSLAACCDLPGDLNQGLMELGATVCTPKAPNCSSCPLRFTCRAYAKVEKEKKISAERLMSKGQTAVPDIECLFENCGLCLPPDEPWNSSLGVQNFPRKAKRKAAREQSCCVCVVCRIGEDSQHRFLVMQRPDKGLLAGLWEFPSTDVESGNKDFSSSTVLQQLRELHGVNISHAEQQAYLGQVVHIFSHIRQTYLVSMVTAKAENITMATDRSARWLTKEELDSAAVPTAMKKVFKLYSDGQGQCKQGTKRKAEEPGKDVKKQRTIVSFFTSPRR